MNGVTKDSGSARNMPITWTDLTVACPFPVADHTHIKHTPIEIPLHMLMKDARLGLGPDIVQTSSTSIPKYTEVGDQPKQAPLGLDLIPMNDIVRIMNRSGRQPMG
jgi:hypothetical protein